jgi:uncharacterized protein (TIGR03086 family)
MTNSASNRGLLTAAITQFDNVVRAAQASSARKPTPCPDYDVTELIAHVAIVVGRLAHALRTPRTGQGDDPNWASARDQALQAIATADPGKTITLPFGTMPAQAAYGVLLGELATRSWDLAVAIDRPDLLDQTSARQQLLSSRRAYLNTHATGCRSGRSSPPPPTHRPTTGSPDGWAETRHGD